MQCPFLRGETVRYCEISPFRKMISKGAPPAGGEMCSSPDYVDCLLVKTHREAPAGRLRCPFLRTALVQYCSATPATCLIPYSDALVSRCMREGHRYCDLFLSRINPEIATSPASAGGKQPEHPEIPAPAPSDGIEVPERLAYSPNHMWLDLSIDGSCHVGVDGFFAKVIGEIDRVTFSTIQGLCRPSAVLSAGGVDLTMTFPNRLHLTGLNVSLRSDPSRIARDPYGLGWLFEAQEAPERATRSGPSAGEGLISGSRALEWMAKESDCLARYVREKFEDLAPGGAPPSRDGEHFPCRLAGRIGRDDLLRLHETFFAAGAEGGPATPPR